MEELFESELYNFIHNISLAKASGDPLEDSPFNSESHFRKDSYTEIPMDESSLDNSNERGKITSSIRKRNTPKRKYHKKDYQPRFCKGKWNLYEEHRYFQFIQQTAAQHPSWSKDVVHNKKRWNYFVEMSAYIGTRNSIQCRSHDQKIRHKLAKEGKTLFLYEDSATSPEEKLIFRDQSKSESTVQESSPLRESELPITPPAEESQYNFQNLINNVEECLNFVIGNLGSEDYETIAKMSHSAYQEIPYVPQVSAYDYDQPSDELYSLVEIVRKRLLQVGGGVLDD